MRESMNPTGVAEPVGPYAQVVRADGGTLVFVSGCVAFDAEGNVVGEGDIEAQTRQCMENMAACLRAAGATFADVVKITNFVLDAGDYRKVAPIREEYLRAPYPASTLIEVKGLLLPQLLVEIEAVAVVNAPAQST